MSPQDPGTQSQTQLPLVAIVGRPNVGKSTLFNRLIRQRRAIVEAEPGVTRDRIYGEADWEDVRFRVVDTGGLVPGGVGMTGRIAEQVHRAISESSVLILLVDAREGVTGHDLEVAERARRSGKRVILAANKVDSPGQTVDLAGLYEVGLGDPIPISAYHGVNVDELLDAVISDLPRVEASESEGVRIAVVGRPNVGKSSLVNRLAEDERMLVDEVAGTTRDAVDVPCVWGGTPVVLIDTAGLRRRSRVERGIEFFSVNRALRSIRRCDVCVLMIDAVEGVASQDCRIAHLVEKEGRGCVIALNKWDLVLAADRDPRGVPKGEPRLREQHLDALRFRLTFLDYSQVVFTSALAGSGLGLLMQKVIEAAGELTRRAPTHELTELAARAFSEVPPRRGAVLRARYCAQVAVSPPTFAVFVNRPSLVTPSDERHVVARIRGAYGFTGVPLRLFIRKTQRRRKGASGEGLEVSAKAAEDEE